MTGGVMMTSDKLDELSSDRINLFKQFTQKHKMICDFPLLGRSNEFSETDYDPIIVQIQLPMSNENHEMLIFIFNSGEEPVKRIFDLEKLKVPKTSNLTNWLTGDNHYVTDNELSVDLEPHDGVLLVLSS
jgi:hypothetical protein